MLLLDRLDTGLLRFGQVQILQHVWGEEARTTPTKTPVAGAGGHEWGEQESRGNHAYTDDAPFSFCHISTSLVCVSV